jgi:amino acid transporter
LLWYPSGAFSPYRFNQDQSSKTAGTSKDYERMRLKLVFTSSVVASTIGAGSAIAIILSVFSSLKPITAPGLLVLGTFLLPAVAILLATIFVYRHTARRRKLQAALTVIISLVLTIAFFVIGTIVTSRINPLPPQPGTQRNTT